MEISRRAFGAAAVTVVPRHVLGGQGHKAPSDRLNLAGVGVGGMGRAYLANCETENIAALCDVDDAFAAKTFEKYPQARRYRDFRKMLEAEKGIDAVVIGTPDHTHAVIAISAMRMGKHVYCAKPLTRTVAEARAVRRVARESGVATQMSVQSAASEGSAAVCDWIWSGRLGKVREAHVWSNRPIWPQGCVRPTAASAAPETLDWDLWLGPAPARPYHVTYHPFSWRGWWDFGTGALGDMGCHALHTVFRALDLKHPTRAHASASFAVEGVIEGARLRPRKVAAPESAPMASIVTWDFPGVRLTWYDGGLKPPRPAELEPDRPLRDDGVLYIGDKGMLLTGFTGGPQPVPLRDAAPPEKRAPRTAGHYQEWIAACKGGPPAHCEFGFGSLITEVALMGNLALRSGRLVEWNDPALESLFEEPYRAGWSL